MNNEKNSLKFLVAEIVLMIMIMLIIIPICVNASHNYKEKKSNIQQYNNIAIDIKYIDSNKYVNVSNYNDEKKVINLIMKTTKFSNEYIVYLDDKEYRLNDIPHTEDKDYYYFNLGSYEVRKVTSVKFSLNLLGDEIYDDSITYSFVAEVANC
ncbi:MAG: hypothetical protein IKF19_04195 [Bacilli bacterium]|nr:hypothetical protein [Bacilli bacterium]